MRLGADQERVGLGQRLQACGEVGGLADGRVLLRHAFADEIADHDDARGDADARLQRHALQRTSTLPTASRIDKPARTARSASSSCAAG